TVTIQGLDIRNIFLVHPTEEIYFYRSRQRKYILCDLGDQNIFGIHGVCQTNTQ
ncbi:hypothetical protein K443DRAFT_104716, partial [Laccaria amethystina LaAM-08-1]